MESESTGEGPVLCTQMVLPGETRSEGPRYGHTGDASPWPAPWLWEDRGCRKTFSSPK